MNSRSLASSILFVAAAFCPALAAIPRTTAFVDVAVVPMDHERVMGHQTVLVRGDRIVELGAADRVHPPRGAFVIDGRNRFLIPGLTDAQYVILQQLVRGLRDAGVPLLAGTDSFVPCQLPGFSMKDELEQLNAAGLTPFEALRSATSNPSRFLDSDGDSGTVASGKIADLVLLEANPLEDVDNVFRRDGVMVRGRWFPESDLQARLSQLAAARH